MNGRDTGAGSGARAKGKTHFRRLREMRDVKIDDSDIPKLDKSFWKKSQAHHAGAKGPPDDPG